MGLEAFSGVGLSAQMGFRTHLDARDRFMMHSDSSRDLFLESFGGPKETKIDEELVSEDAKNGEGENLDF